MTPTWPQEDWDADAALSSLTDDRRQSEESEEDQARRVFKENSANAAMSIVHLSMRSRNERLRLQASQYIVDRVLGPAGRANEDASKGPLEDLLATMVVEAETYANEAPRTAASTSNLPAPPSQPDQAEFDPNRDAPHEIGPDGLPDLK